MKELDFNITIVGLGLIGGSFAMALKDLNTKSLWAIDIDENIIKDAEKLKIIDKGYINPQIPLENSDIVIMCLYPELTIKFIKDNINSFKSGAIITDTCGIKDKVIEKINSFIRNDIDFIGGHPMAGKESKGLQAACKDIFKNANYIITPTERNKDENINLIKKMAKAVGFKNIVCIPPEKHDKIISFTSQLPHVIAVSLMNTNITESNIGLFTGGSFKDATRVAVINSILWSQLFMLNSKNLIDEIERFEVSIKEIKKAIEAEDKCTLNSIFNNASVKRCSMV